MTDSTLLAPRPTPDTSSATIVDYEPSRPGSPSGHLPVSLLVGNRPCLVVGGGPIGARKAASLVRAGARVTIVAPDTCDDVERLASAGHVGIERRLYRSGEAADYAFVTCATGIGEIDAAVSADAQAGGVWVNSADDPANCTVMLPAVHRDGPVTIAISTGGASPALASWLRRRIAAVCGDALGPLAELLADARAQVHAAGRSTESVDWQSILDGPLPDLVETGRLDEARALLARAVA